MKKMDEKEREIKSFIKERIGVFVSSFILAYMVFSIGLIIGASAFFFVIFDGMWTLVMVALAIDTKATILRIFSDEG